jgi:ribose/xylose/arabinose/galactoside ABC-type transport system permease subunit
MSASTHGTPTNTSTPTVNRGQAKTDAAARRWQKFRSYGILLAIILLVIFNIFRIHNLISNTPTFIERGTVNVEYARALQQALSVNLTQVATIVIVGVGMTLVVATGGIDLSVGAVMAIAGQVAPLIFLGPIADRFGMGVANFLALTVPIVVAAGFGLMNGLMVTKLRFQPIIATLVVFIGGRGIAQVLTNGYLQPFKNPSFQYIALGRPLGIPTQVYIMFAVVLLALFLVRRTAFGRYVLAIGGNERAARLAGVPVARVKTLVYVISGALAGIAGLIVVAINAASDANLNGMNMELDAIAATAVGGTSLNGGHANIIGTLLGALLIQLVRYSLISIGVPYEFALVVNAFIILLAVYFQRQKAA